MMDTNQHLWVVKFQNNPQGRRILANELIVTRLAETVGLPVAPADIIEVPESVILAGPTMHLELQRGRRERYTSGQQFGSFFMGGLMPGLVVDYLPEDLLSRVPNINEFSGILALDKWTGNCDGRQAVFHRKSSRAKFRAAFIDHGFCFNANEWNFPDSPVGGAYTRSEVYVGVKGWNSFEPWLSRIERIDWATLSRIAQSIPPIWYGDDYSLIQSLMDRLLLRRERVRELIAGFRDSDRSPFPSWTGSL